jgi:hypothetical protein
MSRLLQGVIPQIKKFALYLGLNPEVATKNWPSRGTYRLAPGSGSVPTFVHNFPLKKDQIADLQFQDRTVRIYREAMDTPLRFNHPLPRLDARNVWTITNRKRSLNINDSSNYAAHTLPRFGQVSEAQEVTL